MKLNNEYKAILFLFKDFLTPYNSRNLSKLVGISHAGMFKLLKKLEIREILKPKRIGKAVIYSLNMNNSVAKREIEMALTLEAQNYANWIEEFDVLKDINNKNKVMVDIIKNGIILFGQEKLTKYLEKFFEK